MATIQVRTLSPGIDAIYSSELDGWYLQNRATAARSVLYPRILAASVALRDGTVEWHGGEQLELDVEL